MITDSSIDATLNLIDLNATLRMQALALQRLRAELRGAAAP